MRSPRFLHSLVVPACCVIFVCCTQMFDQKMLAMSELLVFIKEQRNGGDSMISKEELVQIGEFQSWKKSEEMQSDGILSEQERTRSDHDSHSESNAESSPEKIGKKHEESTTQTSSTPSKQIFISDDSRFKVEKLVNRGSPYRSQPSKRDESTTKITPTQSKDLIDDSSVSAKKELWNKDGKEKRKERENVVIPDSIIDRHSAPFGFSGCLLVKDDGPILPEWLAYHFTVMPLRHLVVALDPYSLTNPLYIFEQYRALGMNITIWDDKDYVFNGTKVGHHTIYGNPQNGSLVLAHRWRQRVFMSQCLRLHQMANRSWVMLHDTDEYLTYNNFREDEGEPWMCSTKNASKARNTCNEDFAASIRSGENPRGRLPEIGALNATIAHFIHKHMDLALASKASWGYLLRECSVLPRLMLGAIISSNNVSIPDGFDVKDFRTFKYRLHGPKQNNWLGKSLVDVSRLPKLTNFVVHNVHRVFSRDQCKSQMTVNNSKAILRLNHYAGSLEEYMSRPGDSRRTQAHYERKNNYDVVGETQELKGWLPKFIDLVGYDDAHRLTKGLKEWALERNKIASRFYNNDFKKVETLSLLRGGILQPSEVSLDLKELLPEAERLSY